jgi:hypothetical protein
MNATANTGLTVLSNSFHSTEYRTRKSEPEVERLRHAEPHFGMSGAERAWVRRVRRTLCGVEGCTCATTQLGERS